MNAWLASALVLMLGALGPCVWLVARGRAIERLLGLDLGGVVMVIVMLLVSQGLGRSSYVDLSLVLAPLAVAGTLVFARFLGRPQ
jgi:multisubunit Na+/H+ antiporter MnhF subunit